MTRSPLVFAAADGSSGVVPDCVADATTLRLVVRGLPRRLEERFGAGGFRTPMPLPAGMSGLAAGSR